MLSDTAKVPRELALIGRHLNLVRATNKHLGSPVNRVEVLARADVATRVAIGRELLIRSGGRVLLPARLLPAAFGRELARLRGEIVGIDFERGFTDLPHAR